MQRQQTLADSPLRRRERPHCARQPQLSKASQHLELAAPSHRPQGSTPRLRQREVVYPQSNHHRTLTPPCARIRESEQRNRIAATMTATMAPRAANRSGVEQNNPSSAWDGGFEQPRWTMCKGKVSQAPLPCFSGALRSNPDLFSLA
jgi:hypothetical protein